jgi:hypothetical protein
LSSVEFALHIIANSIHLILCCVFFWTSDEDIRNALVITTNSLSTLLQLIEQSSQATRDLVEYLWILRGILYKSKSVDHTYGSD